MVLLQYYRSISYVRSVYTLESLSAQGIQEQSRLFLQLIGQLYQVNPIAYQIVIQATD